jgi:hypothetical protein
MFFIYRIIIPNPITHVNFYKATVTERKFRVLSSKNRLDFILDKVL